MKLRKSDLKAVIRECLREILTEDVQLRTSLVREALVDIVGAQRQQAQRQSLERRTRVSESAAPRQRPVQQRTSVVKPIRQRTPEQQLPRVSRGSVSKRRSHEDGEVVEGDLFEALVVDTLQNTLPKQTDRRNPLGSNWGDAVRYTGNQEEGPAARLAQASRMSAEVGVGRVQRRQVVQPPDDDVAPDGLEGVSLSQLHEAVASDVEDRSNVPGSALDDLGLTQRDWSAHVDGGASSFDLAAFASELDDG